ncbi:hypothetical protein EV401DRAFT_1915091 [Pisolithus croceorrhizus]|nr:hypothetical protein EV401DRAFT_1915091 [Pisolithus croceorrhizus]
MSSATAAQIAREAKGIHQGLKELLKTQNPWDKEVEFNRKNLRRLYLRLLLVEPYAKESKDAETHLWMQTSYQFISQYKQKLSNLDRALQQQGRPPRRSRAPQDENSDQQQQDERKHGPVEYRKLMQRFRQFLAEEEKFWIRFIARYHRQFNISEARPVLVELGEISSTANIKIPELGDTSDGGAAGPAVANSEVNAENENTLAGDSTTRPPRDHFGFPPEDTITSQPSPGIDDAERRAAGLAIVTKALVCLGDIARYRELHNESGGRPKAGHEDGPGVGPARRGRNRRGGPNGSGVGQVTRARTYDRSISLYEHARALVPSDGNAAHQLGILAFYGGDIFLALYWYWRALCVKVPYEAAVENVRKVLARAAAEGASKWSSQVTRGEGDEEVLARKVEQMKENIAFLHALLRVGAKRLNVSADVLASHVAQSFKSLVSERALPTDMVTRVVVLAQGALWKHRMLRDVPRVPSSPRLSKSREHDGRSRSRSRSRGMDGIDEETSGPNPDDTNVDTPAAIESQIFMHLISLHHVLFEVGAAQLATPPPSDASENDLAPRITAVFRRMLPALRVASKWMVGNVSYIIKVFSATSPEADMNDTKGGEIEDAQHGGITLFFIRFTEFYTALGKLFPFEKLPRLEAPLDEDVDLRGFLPLRGKMIGDDIGDGRGQATPSSAVEGATKQKGDKARSGAYAPTKAAEKVHPNEEQLMRIWDLLADAQALVKVKDFPVRMEGAAFLLDDARFTIGTKSASPIAPTPSTASPLPSLAFSPKLLDTRRQPRACRLRQPHEQRGLAQPIVMSDHEQEDDAGTDACRTDDDPVGDAFREVLDNRASSGSELDEEEDEEQIVWNPRPITSPPKTVIPTAPTLPETVTADAMTVKPTEPPKEPTVMATPSLNSAVLPFPPNRVVASSKPKSPSAAAGTTAQDLLNSVMSLGGSRNGTAGGFGASPSLGLSPRLAPSAIPSQPFLFGAGLQSSPLSIWSTSLDRDHPTAHSHQKSVELSQGIESSVSLGERNRPYTHTHVSAHSHALPVSTPGAGLTSVWPPSLAGGASHHSSGISTGTSSAELPLTPIMHAATPMSDAHHIPQSFQTIRGPGPSHHRTLSLSLSGSPQAAQQTMSHRIPPHGLSGFSSSAIGAFPSDSLLPSSVTSPTMRPSTMAASSLSGGSGLSYHPTAGPKFTDPAIVSMAGSTLGPAPPPISLTGISPFEVLSSSDMPTQRSYLQQGAHSSRPMSFSTWGNAV